MAVTQFEGGWSLAAAGDAASWPGYNISVYKIHIVKTTAGTVTIKEGAGNNVVITESIGDGASKEFNFSGGWEVSSLEYDAVSAGSAVVTVWANPVKSTSHLIAEES